MPSVYGPEVSGNIYNLFKRNRILNADGSFSTTRSMSVEEDGKQVLIPTIVDGKQLGFGEAVDHYRRTGEHLGKFKDVESADEYARKLSEAQGVAGALPDMLTGGSSSAFEGSYTGPSVYGPDGTSTEMDEELSKNVTGALMGKIMGGLRGMGSALAPGNVSRYLGQPLWGGSLNENTGKWIPVDSTIQKMLEADETIMDAITKPKSWEK